MSYFIIDSQSKCVLGLFLGEKDCQYPVSDFGALLYQILGRKTSYFKTRKNHVFSELALKVELNQRFLAELGVRTKVELS